MKASKAKTRTIRERHASDRIFHAIVVILSILVFIMKALDAGYLKHAAFTGKRA